MSEQANGGRMSQQNHGNFVQGYMNPLPEPVTDEDIVILHTYSEDTIERPNESRDLFTGFTPAQEFIRTQVQQQEGFFQHGWTQEHTGWLLVLVVLGVIMWYKPGGKA